MTLRKSKSYKDGPASTYSTSSIIQATPTGSNLADLFAIDTRHSDIRPGNDLVVRALTAGGPHKPSVGLCGAVRLLDGVFHRSSFAFPCSSLRLQSPRALSIALRSDESCSTCR